MEIKSENVTVNTILDILNYEISKYNEKLSEIESLNLKISTLNDILRLIGNGIEIFFENAGGLDYLYETIVNEKDAKNYSEKIYSAYYKISHSNNPEEIGESMKYINHHMKQMNSLLSILQYKKNDNEKMSKDRWKIIKYGYIKSNIRNKGYINETDKAFLIDLLMSYKIEAKKAVELIESINNYHNRVNNKDNNINFKYLLALRNDYPKYEINDEEEIMYQEKFREPVISLRTTLTSDGLNSFIETFREMYQNNLSIDEYDYIMKKILNNLIDNIGSYVEQLYDLDVYKDKELRIGMLNEYEDERKKMIEVTRFYKYEREIYTKKEQEAVVEQESNEELNIENTLIFNDDGTVFIRDMSQMPEECYNKIVELLNGLKYDTLLSKNNDGFKNNDKLNKYKKLKSDQIRIVYRRLNSNYCEIIGVFQKKDDDETKKYMKMVKRFISYDDDMIEILKEQSKIAEQQIETFANTKKRDGSRYQ